MWCLYKSKHGIWCWTWLCCVWSRISLVCCYAVYVWLASVESSREFLYLSSFLLWVYKDYRCASYMNPLYDLNLGILGFYGKYFHQMKRLFWSYTSHAFGRIVSTYWDDTDIILLSVLWHQNVNTNLLKRHFV